MTEEIKRWSEVHKTSEPIAEAIHRLADYDPIEVERIWQYPEDRQLKAIWVWSTKMGQLDDRELMWNSRPLADIML